MSVQGRFFLQGARRNSSDQRDWFLMVRNLQEESTATQPKVSRIYLSADSDGSTRHNFQKLLAMGNADDCVLFAVGVPKLVDAFELYITARIIEIVETRKLANARDSVCEIVSPTISGHGFYLGNGWLVSNSHVLDSRECVPEAVIRSIIGGNGYEYKVQKLFAYILKPDPNSVFEFEASPDVLLINVGAVDGRIGTTGGLPTGSEYGENDPVHILTSAGKYSATVSGVCYRSAQYIVFELSSSHGNAFAHGDSGSPVFDVVGTLIGILFQCRAGMGYMIAWFSFDLLSVVQNCVVALENNDMNRFRSLIADSGLHYHLPGHSTEMLPAEFSYYRIGFSGLFAVWTWMTEGYDLVPELMGFKKVTGDSLPTWLIPYKSGKHDNKDKDGRVYLIVHCHQRADSSVSLNFNNAKACPNVTPASAENVTPAEVEARLKSVFEAWGPLELAKSKKKKFITYKDGEWSDPTYTVMGDTILKDLKASYEAWPNDIKLR